MKFDPRDKPAYVFSEASRYVQVPAATLRTWFHGYKNTDKKSGKARTGARLIAPVSKQHLSFYNLVEAHVLAAIRRKHKIAPDKVRAALSYTSKELKIERPLLNIEFETNGVDLFVDRLGHLIQVSARGQTAMREVLKAHLTRIERDKNGIPIRLYPFALPGDVHEQARLVVINPEISFGRPILVGTNVPTEIVVDRFNAGDSIDDLAADYGLTRRNVEAALRIESLARKAA